MGSPRKASCTVCSCKLKLSQSFACSSVCVLTGVKPNYWESPFFLAKREKHRETTKPQSIQLSNTYAGTQAYAHCLRSMREQRDKGWLEEGMYPSLPVSDNMGLHPALHDWIQITISILCPLSCPPNYIPNIPQNLNVVA